MAQGYVPKEIAGDVEGWETEILGKKLKMVQQVTPAFDANSSRMRR